MKIFFGSKVSEIVTERILEQLEKGIVPWHKSWRVDSRPVNWETRRPYNGVNLFLLEPGGEYLTFRQINKLGAKLKKGAKGYIVVFWKVDTVKQETRDIPEDEETVEVHRRRTTGKHKNSLLAPVLLCLQCRRCRRLACKEKRKERNYPGTL